MDVDGGNKRVFHRLAGATAADTRHHQKKVCYHWQAGNCNRHPCPFLHSATVYGSTMSSNNNNNGRRSQTFMNGTSTWGHGSGGGNHRAVRKADKVCNYWVQGNCGYGERCKFIHSWSCGDGFSLLTQLEGHTKVVSGIALPSGSDKLYTASIDETLRVWDCQSGQCTAEINVGGEVGCMINEGPWIFVGIPNCVKAWNTQTCMELSLQGPVGQVYALVVNNDILFAGTQDGSILAWKFNVVVNVFEPAASLTGHSRGVVSLVVGPNRLYSASMDNTIRVWNLEHLQCLQILTDHTSIVMSVLCWDQFLLSCSLDKTVKVWVTTESGKLEVTYTHKEEHGVVALCGVHDSQGKPILLCSCTDNTLRLYELPSFLDRGKIFTKQEIRTIKMGPGGIFFTGDGSGQVRVWNWIIDPTISIQ
ncbi:hypothetical protein HN51_057068 [Arachis hypogaea]|uniref:Zinc finger CCCH domain-containing protein n=1 Tax=Arachis hypogaea TaxID=3818 RepID=A0A444XX42_ARAHY|nr:zinc finger CCCH domain-containing protein 48 [Arachis ipaensis]XP_025677434.1 zinc finger CCCH domain-containing protein 48-like [Arachis hypogaea]QHN80077.1 Zinc finger CCCH domain-containing protein [Arachis hypogaea]RYQ93995.1 hypothetical protein Ahy_B09g100205 [Arachis hypogaea]